MDSKPAISPRPLTFVLPPPAIVEPSSPGGGGGTTANNFLNRLSRRISQSGAHLKRKVSKGGGARGPVRRASETDKENRGVQPRPPAIDLESSTKTKERLQAQEPPRKATLKRGLRVSVMRRTKSEGAPTRERATTTQDERVEELEPVVRDASPPGNEDASERSSHRGSYFYTPALGICWDGRERVHPDAFAFTPYSSNCDVLPSPVVATDRDDRVVYASTLSSFPPRPPLRPRTPPALTPASQIAAAYRALHPKTPSVYSFSDFDTPPVLEVVDPNSNPDDDELEETTPTNASPGSASPRPGRSRSLEPIDTATRPREPHRYSCSVHSSIASSRPSDTFCAPLTPGLSEDSSTSLESLARDGFVGGRRDADDRDGAIVVTAKDVPRFSLVDCGPIALLHPKPSKVFSEGSSTIDTWKDCEN